MKKRSKFRTVSALGLLGACSVLGSWLTPGFSGLCTSAQAATVTWTGAVDSSWFTAGNWSGSSVPGAADDVTLGSGNTVNARLTSSQVLNGQAIHVQDGARLNVTADGGIYLQAKQSQLSLEGGTVFWNNESRIVSDIGSVSTVSYVQTGGVMRATGVFGSINGGTANLSGGIFSQSAANGELIVGLDRATQFNLSGSALVDVSNTVISGRGGSSSMTISGGTLLVRALDVGWCRGMTVGGGDGSGSGTFTMTGGTVNILSGGNLYIGSSSYTTQNRNVTGVLSLSGGEINVASDIFVGKTGSQNTTQNGTLNLSGDGILRAGTLTLGTATTQASFSGGTLVVGTFNGNFTNTGTTIAPETWNFVQNPTPTTYNIDSNTYKAADEYLYEQTSRFGASTFSGTFSQTSGNLVLDYDSESSHDALTASSFSISGGVLTLNYGGTLTKESTTATLTGLFSATNTSAVNTFDFSSKNLTDAAGHHLFGTFDAATGALTLEYKVLTWTGAAGDSNWNTAGNWDRGIVSPSSNEYCVEIGNAARVNVDLAQGTLYGLNLKITGGATLSSFNSKDLGLKSWTIESGTVNWGVGTRMIFEETDVNRVVLEQTGGTINATGPWTTWNGGTMKISGGALLEKNGVLNIGLDQTTIANVSGSAVLSVNNLVVGGRNYGSSKASELNVRGGTLLVRGNQVIANYGRGLMIGWGDRDGSGSMNVSGGVVNVLANAVVDVGGVGNESGQLVTVNKSAKGSLMISGGEMNVAGTLNVGRVVSSSSGTQNGTLALSGGTLRAGSIKIGVSGTASASWTGGTLSVGSYSGADFVNSGASIAPETWTFNSGTANTASEKTFSRTSVFGTSTFSGKFIQNSGSVLLDLGVTDAGTGVSDVLSASSFTFSGGSAKFSLASVETGAGTISGGNRVRYEVFKSTGSGVTNTWLGVDSVTFDSSVTDRYFAEYNATNGQVTLSSKTSLFWGGGNGNWKTASGWNQGIVPTTAFDTYILDGTVAHDGNIAFRTLTVGGTATVRWNNWNRIVQGGNLNNYIFQMHGGNFISTGGYATFGSGKFLFDGGLFRVKKDNNGILLLGLDNNSIADIRGTAQLDLNSISIGGRFKENYTSRSAVANVAGNSTMLVRGATSFVECTGSPGLFIGTGDNEGNGTLNLSENGTINVLGGNVYVGSGTNNKSGIGLLAVSGGEMNVTNTIYVGKYRATDSASQTGTLNLSGGTLRAKTINVAEGSTVSLTGGTISFDTFNGNLINQGATLAPETWHLERDATQVDTALEYVYEHDSSIASMVVNGDYEQHSGTIELTVTALGADSFQADNLNVEDGTLSLIFEGEQGYGQTGYQLFKTTSTSGLMELDFSEIVISGLSDETPFLFDRASGVLYVGAPEPASWLLLGLGSLGGTLLIFRRGRRESRAD